MNTLRHALAACLSLPGGPLYSHYDFALGGKKFAVYNADHHHSFGDLVVYQADGRILWISAPAFNNRITFMGGGHSESALAAMDWMRAAFRGARLMVPGHGSAQTPPFPMVDRTYSYVRRLREEMGRTSSRGWTSGPRSVAATSGTGMEQGFRR